MIEFSWYFILGFVAQGLFSARVLIQWVLSEKAKKVVSPSIYWQISLLASFLFSIYGWLRGDIAIIIGQIFSYYIYIWNLKAQNKWEKIHVVGQVMIVLTPFVALVLSLWDKDATIDRFNNIPLGWILFGSIGQIVFTFRFIYQWLYSRSRNESLLPTGFWTLSLIGSLITIIYGVFRKDPVLIIGQGAGFIAYARNLWLSKNSSK